MAYIRQVWKTWFEIEEDTDTKEAAAHDSGFAEFADTTDCTAPAIKTASPRGRTIHRGSLERNHSLRSLSIDGTIARATLRIFPEVKSEADRNISRTRAMFQSSQYEFAWESLELNISRVVCGHEENMRRKAGRIVLFWAGGPTVRRPPGPTD